MSCLETVNVIGKNKWRNSDVKDIAVSFSSLRRSHCQKTLDNVMSIFRIRAENIIEQSNINVCTHSSKLPSWKSWHNWDWIWLESRTSSNGKCDGRNFHFLIEEIKNSPC